jgi:hypothetical protein
MALQLPRLADRLVFSGETLCGIFAVTVEFCRPPEGARRRVGPLLAAPDDFQTAGFMLPCRET